MENNKFVSQLDIDGNGSSFHFADKDLSGSIQPAKVEWQK